jgi:translocator assembly and maintenance protein 41
MTAGAWELGSWLRAALPPVAFAAAYGSAVMPQAGQAPGRVVDLLVAVDDARGGEGEAGADDEALARFHAENRARNTRHYSLAARMMPLPLLVRAQRAAAGLWYNGVDAGESTALPVALKYGVVALSDLERDLREWHALYAAGRLHKPVLELVPCARLAGAQRANLDAALAAALLQLPARFSELQLFEAVCALSYSGDIRQGVAELPDKVPAIVRGSLEGLRALYAEPLERAAPLVAREAAASFRQDTSPAARHALFRRLPDSVQQRATQLAGGRAPHERVREVAADAVRRTSIGQTAKGLLSYGVVRSLRYAVRKVGRRIG